MPHIRSAEATELSTTTLCRNIVAPGGGGLGAGTGGGFRGSGEGAREVSARVQQRAGCVSRVGGYGRQKTASGKPRTGSLDHRRRSLTLERGWTVVAKQRRALRGKEAARQGLGRPEGEARAVGTAGTLVAASSVGQGCQHHGGRSPVAPVLVGQRSAGLCTPEGGG